MAPLTRGQRAAFFALFAVYAAIVIPLGVRKGDDIVSEIGQADLLLRGGMLNAVAPGQGQWWPPFALVLVAPFALVAQASLPLAKALWGAVGVAALAWSVHETGRRWGWRPALAALGVILFPVHNNFHHLNIESILLALLVAAAIDASRDRPGRAGLWVGLATAIKVFPGLLLPYFALRRQWKALGVATAAATGATLLALLPYGPHGIVQALGNWLHVGAHGSSYQGGAIVALHMQKLGRLGYALGGAPGSIVVAHLIALGLVAALLARRTPAADTLAEIGAVTLLAVLLTPVAWLHTFTLGYLAWVAVCRVAPSRRATRWVVAIAAVYASTALSAIPWPPALGFVTFHNDTLGALVALALLVVFTRARQAAAVLPTGSPHPA
jgi:alpha-1,2-mannosyltransferase